nr:tail protein X [uncultured Holophaga sp.]
MASTLTHTTTDGDRWDLLAWEYYGDLDQIPTLTAANPGVSLNPILEAGVSLVVPVIEQADASTPGLPPWRS